MLFKTSQTNKKSLKIELAIEEHMLKSAVKKYINVFKFIEDPCTSLELRNKTLFSILILQLIKDVDLYRTIAY